MFKVWSGTRLVDFVFVFVSGQVLLIETYSTRNCFGWTLQLNIGWSEIGQFGDDSGFHQHWSLTHLPSDQSTSPRDVHTARPKKDTSGYAGLPPTAHSKKAARAKKRETHLSSFPILSRGSGCIILLSRKWTTSPISGGTDSAHNGQTQRRSGEDGEVTKRERSNTEGSETERQQRSIQKHELTLRECKKKRKHQFWIDEETFHTKPL